MVKSFKKKIQRLLNPSKKVQIRTIFKTTSLAMFATTKDPVPTLSKSNVVYQVSCPGCGKKYIGKTERTLHERSKEHAWNDVESPLRNHLPNCTHFNHLHGLLSMNDQLFDDDIGSESIDSSSLREFSIESVRQSIQVLDMDSNWNRLLFKESLAIERNNPDLNRGLKASRQLQLFR